MLDFLAPFLAGALTEYCRSRRISKIKVFFIFFILFFGICAAVGFFVHPDETQLNVMIGAGLGLAMATIVVVVLAVDEVSERKIKQRNEKKPD